MPERIRIKARFADQCPLFKAGEGMTLELPGVVPARCHNICAASLHAFHMLHEMRKGAVDGREYTCTWTNCRATMTIDVGAEFPDLKAAGGATVSTPPKPATVIMPSPSAPASPAPTPAALASKVKSSNPLAAFLAAAAPKASEGVPPGPPTPAPGSAPTEAERTKTRVAGIAARLKTAPIFQGLPMEELERIAAAVKLVTYVPPAVLLKTGDPGEKYYLIVTGRVDVSKVDQDGTEKILSSLGAGQGVGEMSLLTGEKCSATVRVTETVQAMVLTRAEFEEMLETAPQLNRHFNRILADRLRSTNQKLTDVIQNGVLGKLSMFSLAELTQALAVSGRTGYLHLTHRNVRGFLTVRDGFVFNVKLAGKDRAEDAFLEMMNWREGEFRFEQSDISTLGLRPIDTTSLLMEGARRADEKARAAAPAGAAPPSPPSAS